MTEIPVSTHDVIVLGAGAAGMAAACTAASLGKKVLLIDCSDRVGGTTAISGGMVWIPANHKMLAAGVPDSLNQARNYLGAAVPGAQDDARLESFLTHGDEAIQYLEAHTSLRFQPVNPYPDYHPHLEGATLGGRVLEPVPFDGQSLGADFRLLRDPLPEFMLFGGMMVSRKDLPILRQISRSPRALWHAMRLSGRYLLQRLSAHRGTTLYLGNALAARLFHSLRQLQVDLRLSTRVNQLWAEEGRVVGVIGTSWQKELRLRARHGVILATGGISHHASLRQDYVPSAVAHLSATIDAGSETGGVYLACQAGAQRSRAHSSLAFWVPVSFGRRTNGTRSVFPHTVTDRAKPGLIAVDSDGKRFTNEAVSYHDFVSQQLKDPARRCPAWLICDSDFLWRYGLGRIKPFALTTRQARASGDLIKADTVSDLAVQIGVPGSRLCQTIEVFNQSAVSGQDPEFHRGGDAYQRHLGDSQRRPNPCVAPLTRAPFYALAVYPADLGMAAGVMTTPHGQAVDEGGHPIDGLYVCGNDMHSVMNGAYPGPGITLGPALVFAYLAARHACSAP
jgi:succinate dehydrogenase/fumarate reductase flavoprotein subunit